jgi:hypothetical protein
MRADAFAAAGDENGDAVWPSDHRCCRAAGEQHPLWFSELESPQTESSRSHWGWKRSWSTSLESGSGGFISMSAGRSSMRRAPESQFAPDSSLAGEGFEPSVPDRERAGPFGGMGTVTEATRGSLETAHLTGDRGFESLSLTGESGANTSDAPRVTNVAIA